jgi:hypothetical protein
LVNSKGQSPKAYNKCQRKEGIFTHVGEIMFLKNPERVGGVSIRASGACGYYEMR